MVLPVLAVRPTTRSAGVPTIVVPADVPPELAPSEGALVDVRPPVLVPPDDVVVDVRPPVLVPPKVVPPSVVVAPPAAVDIAEVEPPVPGVAPAEIVPLTLGLLPSWPELTSEPPAPRLPPRGMAVAPPIV